MSDVREQFRPPNHQHEHFLLTTVVGSYPKPNWLRNSRDQHDDAELSDEDWEEALDDASRLITLEHERAGLDAVVDGEMRRTEMVEYFAERIGGYEFHGPVKVWGHNYFDKPSVVEELSYEEPWLEAEFRYTDEVASRPVKVPITGPYTLASWSFNEHYEDTETLANVLATLVRREVEVLVDAGAKYIQIDEPALATTPDDHRIVGDCLETVTESIPADVRTGLHVCYGDYSRIYPEILEYPVDEFDIELANKEYEQVDVFKDPPFTKDFAPGVVDAHDASVESIDTIEGNIRKALSVVPPERLTVSPDCGLKLLPRQVAFEKTRNMVRAARNVEEKLDEGIITPDA